MGISHLQRELGMQPVFPTAAEPSTVRSSISKTVDDAISEYAKNRAFQITGLIKTEVLDKVKDYITRIAQGGEVARGADIEAGIRNMLSDFLPRLDAAGRKINWSARAVTIVRTNVSDLYNTARMMMFNAPGIREIVVAFKYSAVLDSRTTAICRTLNGRIFTRDTLNGFIPPNHFNCRSMLLPVTQADQGWDTEYYAQTALPPDLKPQEGFEN